MAEIEKRVIALVAEETRMNPMDVKLDLRLGEDIGMDGDDAVEFFEKFSETFHVNLTLLKDHWDQHFGGEVGPGGPRLLVVIVASVIVAGVLHEWVPWVPMGISTIVLAALSFWIYGRFFDHDEKLPVTVRDLVDAADSGKWAKEYEGPVSAGRE